MPGMVLWDDAAASNFYLPSGLRHSREHTWFVLFWEPTSPGQDSDTPQPFNNNRTDPILHTCSPTILMCMVFAGGPDQPPTP
jgi:hypothetical protein